MGDGVGGTKVWSLGFSDDIDLLAMDEVEANEIADRLSRNSKKYGVEINHQLHTEIHRRVEQLIGPNNTILQIVKKRKLRWFGYVARAREPWRIPYLAGKRGRDKTTRESSKTEAMEWAVADQ